MYKFFIIFLFLVLISCEKPDYKVEHNLKYGSINFINRDTLLCNVMIEKHSDYIYFDFYKDTIIDSIEINRKNVYINWSPNKHIIYYLEGYVTVKENDTINCIVSWNTQYTDSNSFKTTNRFYKSFN